MNLTIENQTDRLYELYGLAMANKLVKSKTDFAELIGIKAGTISYAFAGDTARVNLQRTIERAETALQQHGVVIDSSTNTIIGDNNSNNQNTDTPPALLDALRASQDHVSSLLSQQAEFLTIIKGLTSK